MHITLAAVMGGYTLASHLHVSGPLAMIVVGLVIGNQGRALAMSDSTREHLDMFLELLDEILNAVLFALIALEVVFISPSKSIAGAVVVAVLVTLAARAVSVGVPFGLLRRAFSLPSGSFAVLV